MTEQRYPILEHASFKGFIGVSQGDITPPIGIQFRNWGASKFEVSEGAHRPITLTCISFQIAKNEKPLILFGADLSWWKSAQEEKMFRKEILDALSLEEERLMFCLSHTHAGPSIFKEDKTKAGGEFVEAYVEHIKATAIQIAKKAIASSAPSVLTWHYGKCNLATNRDLEQKEKQRYIVGFNEAKDADDTLLVGRITDEQDKILATIINYACHPTTLAWDNKFVSPDYIGAMRELVEKTTGGPCLFLQGASGNLAPNEQYVGSLETADKHGRQLGYAVLSTLESMLAPSTTLQFENVVESGAPLAVWKRVPYAPATVLAAARIPVAFTLKPLPSLAEIEKNWQECTDPVLKERWRRKRSVRKTVGEGDTAMMPLWVWQLGNSFIIGHPDEAYQDFQITLRQQLSPYSVAVMNLVNGTAGYLPNSDLYKNDMYTVWQTPFAAGSLEVLTKTALDTAKQMRDSNT